MIFKTPASNRYLIFVGNDFKLRAYDITYHYEGIATFVFEQALPKAFSESYDYCERLDQLQEGYFFVMCANTNGIKYNVAFNTNAKELEDETLIVRSMMRQEMSYLQPTMSSLSVLDTRFSAVVTEDEATGKRSIISLFDMRIDKNYPIQNISAREYNFFPGKEPRV